MRNGIPYIIIIFATEEVSTRVIEHNKMSPNKIHKDGCSTSASDVRSVKKVHYVRIILAFAMKGRGGGVEVNVKWDYAGLLQRRESGN